MSVSGMLTLLAISDTPRCFHFISCPFSLWSDDDGIDQASSLDTSENHVIDSKNRTIAVTPMKLQTTPFEETCKISRDYAITAIQALDALRHKQARPLRFLYMSGHFATRSPAEVPKELQDHGLIKYGLLRVCIDERGNSALGLGNFFSLPPFPGLI